MFIIDEFTNFKKRQATHMHGPLMTACPAKRCHKLPLLGQNLDPLVIQVTYVESPP